MRSRSIISLLLLGLLLILPAGCEKKNAKGKVSKGKVAPAELIAPQSIIGGYGMEPGQFNEPRDIDVDSKGNLYIADFRNYCVQVLDPNGKPIRKFGTKGARQGQFNDLCGIAVADDGKIFVADTWNHRIQVFDNNGTFLSMLPGSFVAPRGVDIDSQGDIYVADSGNNQIKIFSPGYQLLHAWGELGKGPGQFSEPVGIIVRGETIYVADNDNRRMQMFDLKGKFKQQLQIDGWTAKGPREPYFDLDDQGNMFVSDPPGDRVFMISKLGKVLRVFGGAGGEPGRMHMPTGVAVDPKRGWVYITDTWNHRIQKFSLQSIANRK